MTAHNPLYSWLKKNLTMAIIITLLGGYGVGAMAYGSMTSDIQELKTKILTMPERLARLEEKVDGGNQRLDDLSRGVDFLIKREMGK